MTGRTRDDVGSPIVIATSVLGLLYWCLGILAHAAGTQLRFPFRAMSVASLARRSQIKLKN